jgi:hypothetical protein
MVCQYSTCGFVSSEKHAAPWGVKGPGGDTPGVAIAAEVMGGYGPLLEPPEAVSRAAKVAKTLKSRTPARLYICDAVLERLAYNLKHMALECSLLVSHQSPSWVRDAGSEVGSLNARGMSWKFPVSHPRMVSYTDNLAGVLDLNPFMGLAIRVMAVRDSSSAR